MTAPPVSAPMPPRQLWYRLVVGALALAAVAWWHYPDGTLRVIFPALPGDAVIVRTPGGAALVIDGGGDPAALTAALGRALPFWQREVAALILTSDDTRDLVSHIALLERYQVRHVYVAAQPADTAAAAAWRARGREPHLEPRQHSGVLESHADLYRLGGDLAPADDDDAGARREQSADELQNRRLAASRRADQRHELALPNLERCRVECLERLRTAAVGDLYCFEIYEISLRAHGG